MDITAPGDDGSKDSDPRYAAHPLWNVHIFHRQKNWKVRSFKLKVLGTQSQSEKKSCELCRAHCSSADPLYPQHEREWAYYAKKGSLDGLCCFYCALTHRVRYKAWIRSELQTELTSANEKYDEFMAIVAVVISRKKSGDMELDMTQIPLPSLVVKATRETQMIVDSPDVHIISEAAFKKRHNMTFKEAGLVQAAKWYEVDEGNWQFGILESVGEEGGVSDAASALRGHKERNARRCRAAPDRRSAGGGELPAPLQESRRLTG